MGPSFVIYFLVGGDVSVLLFSPCFLFGLFFFFADNCKYSLVQDCLYRKSPAKNITNRLMEPI